MASRLNDARSTEDFRQAALTLTSRALVILSKTDRTALGLYMDWLVTDNWLTVDEAMAILDEVLDGEENG